MGFISEREFLLTLFSDFMSHDYVEEAVQFIKSVKNISFPCCSLFHKPCEGNAKIAFDKI